MICLGWVNSGLGFQLVGLKFVATHWLVQNFVIMGVLGGLWFVLMGVDGARGNVLKRERIGVYGVGWRKGPVFKKGDEVQGGEKVEG